MVRGVRCRVWMTEGERPIMGEEEAAVLASIRDHGSMDALSPGRGEATARSLVASVEKAAGVIVAAPAPSGEMVLTAEGEALLDEFENKRRRVEEQLAHAFENPILTADGIVLLDGRIVLVRRGKDPGKGMYALPGGFVEVGETAEGCAVREVEEETGLRTAPLMLVGVYSNPGRDPRGHIVSTVFHLRVMGGELKAGDDAAGVELFDLRALPELAFDHACIIYDFLKATGRRH